MYRMFWFKLLAPDDGSGSAPAATSGGEDVTGLKNTIAALRQEVSTLTSQLKQFEGIEPAAARDAMSRVGELEGTNKTLNDRLTARDIDLAVGRVVSGVLPQYQDLVSSNVRGLLQVNDQGQVISTDGRSLDVVRQEYQSKYPNMFVAENAPVGSGSLLSAGSTQQPPAATVVNAPKGVISGVDPDAIIQGKVKVNPTQ